MVEVSLCSRFEAIYVTALVGKVANVIRAITCLAIFERTLYD